MLKGVNNGTIRYRFDTWLLVDSFGDGTFWASIVWYGNMDYNNKNELKKN
jgi:hypothetical protein